MSSSVRASPATALEPGVVMAGPEDGGPEQASRFRPPTPIATIISRPRLHRKLSPGAAPRTVSLLCAPAGAGKTLLLADWVSQQPQRAISWLTLSERDNNAQVLCSSLTEALAEHVAPTARGAPAQSWLSRLMTTIEAGNRPLTLILDDAHELHDPMSISTLDQVIAGAPPNLSIILAARYEPPLMWHRLSLDSRLTRLDAPDLAFDSSEIATLLSEYDIVLDRRQLAIIESFTKGWGAAVRLAGAYLAGRVDTSDAVDEFTHTPRPVADFLVDEVLASLPSHLTEFMLRTSVVDAFSIDLAEALTDADTGTEINTLLQFNLPLTRTDTADRTTWFTYHPLLREHLRAEFRRVDQNERIRALEQAATWFETHHHEVEALELESAIDNPQRLLRFLGRCGLGLVLDGHGSDLVRILESVPPQVSESAHTRMLLAAAALHSGEVTTASTYLNFVDVETSGLERDPLYCALTQEARYAGADSPFDTTHAECRRNTHSDIEAYAHLQTANGHFLSGDFRRATNEYTQSAALGMLRGRSRTVLRALSGISFSAAMEGDFEATIAHSTHALTYAVEHHLAGTSEYEFSTSTAALAAYLCEEAVLPQGVPTLAQDRPADFLSSGNAVFGWPTAIIFGLHRLDTAQDRRTTAADIRDAMLSSLETRTFAIASSALLPAVVNTCISVGELDWASRLIYDASHQFGNIPEVHLARSSLRLAGNRYAEAQIELTAAAHSPTRPLLANGIYEMVTQSALHASNHEPRKAFHSVRAALSAAERGNVLRPFLDYGHALRGILDEFSGHFGDQEPCAERVRAHLLPHELVSVPTLTPGEYTVLRELASGDTTESIATNLYLSVNTIKTHLRGIYRKLEVSNRRDALKAARRGGLI